MAEPLRPSAIFIIGGLYVDEIHEVTHYPEEDTTMRAISVTRRRGGNAGNTSCVLAQLLRSDECCVL